MGNFRGVVKVGGSAIRGWLLDLDRPSRPVRFKLVIDGEVRGSFVADARRRWLSRKAAGQDSHGFSIPIRRPWITGRMQNIGLEDERDLRFSLRARLGPEPHEHFEDNVVSAEASIGAPEKPGRHADEDERDEVTAKPALLRQIRALSDPELGQLLAAVDRDIVLPRLTRHDKDGDWEALSRYRRTLIGGTRTQLLNLFARGAAKAQEPGHAARAATAAAALHPQSFEAHLLAGSVLAAQGKFDEGLRHLRMAERLEEEGHRAKREIAAVLARALRQELAPERRKALREDHLDVLRGLAAIDNAAFRVRYRVPLASALYECGRYDEAIAAADAVLLEAPRETRALLVKARALVARNRVGEARLHFESVLEIDPAHRGARQSLRLLAALADEETADPSVVDLPSATRESLTDLKHHWICTGGWTGDAESFADFLAEHRARCTGFAERDGPQGKTSFWRAEALDGLIESGIVQGPQDAGLARWQRFYAAVAQPQPRKRALLVSRHGADLYGGGEHFLLDVAAHHEAQGYQVILLGTKSGFAGEDSRRGARRLVFLPENPAPLRRFVLENDISLVHAISGTGFLVAEALGFTNIPFVYGVHFWNELLGDGQGKAYFDEISGEPHVRPEFALLLSRAAVVYANSRYTQAILEEGFGVRCPILFAAPGEREAALEPANAAC
ncbi:MAG: glycosyltransferase [Alphaproteobacteria bacterium]|nr:glycosyltransferase [Alphaproteobacteria bacterium]MBV9695238.1 glycosyltransferase [Alphaproteobacteria bacterium]